MQLTQRKALPHFLTQMTQTRQETYARKYATEAVEAIK